MALNKVTYVDGVTVIGAANLNAIQDEIIANASGISDLHDVATTSANGLMSAADKTKLNGIANGATNVTIDNTLTQSGQAADAKTTGDELSGLKSAIKDFTGNQQFNSWQTGKLYRMNVETVSLTPETNASYNCMAIACSPGDVFTVSGGSYGNAARLWGFVKSDGTRLDVEANSVTVENKKITAPANTAWLLVNWYNNGTNVVSVIFGTPLVSRVSADESAISRIDATATDAQIKSNLNVEEYTISNASNQSYATNNYYAFIAKKEFALRSYKLTNASTLTVEITILRYNRADDTYTSDAAFTGNTNTVITIGKILKENDAILYKVSGGNFYGTTVENLFFGECHGWNASLHKVVDSTLGYNLAGEFVVDLSDFVMPESPLVYSGREASVFDNILCIGDSITQGAPTPPDITPDPTKATREVVNATMYSYPASMKKQYGITCTNWGKSGITSQSWYDYYSEEEPSWSGHDAAIMLLGNNDYHLVDDLGGLTPETLPTASTRSKTAMMSIITKLKADNADIKIFICTLLPGWDRATTLSPLVNQNIKDIASTEDNVFLIDLSQFSGITGPYKNNHPTAIGYNRLAREIGGAISYTIVNNPDEFKWIQFIGTEYAMDEE